MTAPGPGSLPRRALLDPPPADGPSEGWLRQLDWRRFERLIGTAFSLQGYAVQETPNGADGGIDLILTRGGERLFVQCKHWRAYQVGVKVVRELFGVVVAHRATAGIVVTSGSYTAEAREFAQRSGVTLLDGPAVHALLAASAITPEAFFGDEFQGRVAPAPTRSRRRKRTPVWAALLRLVASLAAVAVGVWLVPQLITSTLTQSLKPQPLANASAAKLVMGEQPMAITISADGQSLYTANFASGDVTVLNADDHQVTGTIDVPGKPTGIAVDSEKHRLFVADRAGEVHIVDLISQQVTGTIATKKGQSSLAFDDQRHRLYVANADANTIASYDTTTGKRLARVTRSMHPTAVAVNPSENRVYVLAGGTVFAYRGSLAHTNQSWLELNGLAVAVDAQRQLLHALAPGEIHGYNLVTAAGTAVAVSGAPTSLCIDPTESTAYLVEAQTGKVTTLPLK